MNRNVGIDGARDGPDGRALDESEHVVQTIALLLEFPWVYQDFSHNFVPEELFEGMPPEIVAEQTIQLPYVVASRGFLERYSLYGLNGQTLHLDSLAHNTLLVPAEHKDQPFTPVYFDGDPKKEIVFIQNAGAVINLDPIVPDYRMRQIDNPVILFKKHWDGTMNRFQQSLFIRSSPEIEQTIRNHITKNQWEGLLSIATSSHEYDLAMNRSNDRTLSMGRIVLLYLITVAVFQFQSSFMHFHAKQRQLMVQYLQGVGFLRRYKPLLLKSFISGAAVRVLGLHLFHYPSAPILLYVLLGIVVDLLILILMIRRFERKLATSVLKEA